MGQRFCRYLVVAFAILAAASSAVSQTAAKKKSPITKAASGASELNDRQRALHALNRLTFGPRPGEVEAVLAKGVDAFVEDQLHPESIDDSALGAQLNPYATTRMSSKQIAEMFPSDGVLRQVIAGKKELPTDPVQRLIYSVNVARLQQQEQATKAADAAAKAADFFNDTATT